VDQPVQAEGAGHQFRGAGTIFGQVGGQDRERQNREREIKV